MGLKEFFGLRKKKTETEQRDREYTLDEAIQILEQSVGKEVLREINVRVIMEKFNVAKTLSPDRKVNLQNFAIEYMSEEVPEALLHQDTSEIAPILDIIGEASTEEAAARAPEIFETIRKNEAVKKWRVETFRRLGEVIGRNDPCPCCSGKKFKSCHRNDPEGLKKILEELDKKNAERRRE